MTLPASLPEFARRRRDSPEAMRQYGPYFAGKKTHRQLALDTLEELADAWNYAVVFDRVERPYNESERRPVIRALLAAFEAVHAQAVAPTIESPGHPEAGDPPDRSPVAPDPAASGPPAFMGG